MKTSQQEINLENDLENSIDFFIINNDEFFNHDGFKMGEDGYSQIFDDMLNLVDEGVPIVDIILYLREKYDNAELVTTVLEDARAEGYI